MYEAEKKHWWHIAKRKLATTLLENYVNLGKAPKILDIGCGTGGITLAMEKFGTTWGIDNSPLAIKFCKKNGLKNIKLQSSSKTSFPKSKFDVVTVLDVLEHVDDQATMAEIYRVLKPGGVVIITVPAYQWMWSKRDEALQHKRRYNSQTLRKLLESHKFKVKKLSYLYSFLILPVLSWKIVKELTNKNHYEPDFKLKLPVFENIFSLLAQWERLVLPKMSLPAGLTVLAIGVRQK